MVSQATIRALVELAEYVTIALLVRTDVLLLRLDPFRPTMTSDDSRRALFGAVSVSLLLHLIVVFGWYWPQDVPVAVPQQAMHLVVSANSGVLLRRKRS